MSGCGWDEVPFLIAHRGFSTVAPENTLAAFEAAIDAGAEVLECDVQLTADGVPVVVHDRTVDRTTDGVGAVHDLAWSELAELEAGYTASFGDTYRGQRVPRLDELFDLARGRAAVFVEIKPEAVAETADGVEARLVEAARRTGMLDSVGVLSFAPLALQRVREKAPQLPLGLVFHWWRHRRMVEESLAVGADYLIAYTRRLLQHPEIVPLAHAEGLRVGAYVADSAEVVAALLQAGVDGIATNCVGDLLGPFSQMCSA